VGEVATVAPLVRALRERFPAWDLCLSVSTYTGLEVARKTLPGIPAFYSPLDVSFVVRRFFRRIRPDAVILVELELWPGLLIEARLRGVPVLVANGRITARSAARYAKAGGLARRLFGLVTSYGAQGRDHAERFEALGVPRDRVETLGNLKHDRGARTPAESPGELRRRLGWDPAGTVVVVGGSTHPGEEEALVRIHDALRHSVPGLRLVIVPRHVERLDEAGLELSRWDAGDRLVRWSRVRAEPQPLAEPARSVLVVDTLGELESFYGAADIAFVGGSLVPHGGHNVLEASGLGKPVLLGPHHANFRVETDILVGAGGALVVADERALGCEIRRLAMDRPAREEMGRRALETTRGLGGALERHLEWLDRYLQLSSPSRPG
jgi:3-deoxy-D-manno-octulosonic-acid transferase